MEPHQEGRHGQHRVAVGIEEVRAWGKQLDEVARRIGGRFPRSETRDRVRSYLAGLLGPVWRKNAWQVAERIGDADPYNIQYLMGRAEWDPDAVRDDLREAVRRLADEAPPKTPATAS